jgi:3-phenylpropionate/trans-cinnamate dioxygenase ferredoxin reductase subunit
MTPIVIIGAGLAGATAAAELRASGHDGPVVLYGAEAHPPYERPALSKGYLMGAATRESTFVHEQDWYAAHDVELRQGTRVVGLSLDRHVLWTSDGGEQGFAKALLATGSQPRRLALADDSGVPTAYLRTLEDSDRISSAFGQGRRIVIIGAGWIGLEVAAAARAKGTEVVVHEAAQLPLLRVLGPRVAQIFADLHRSHGVDLRLGSTVGAADLAGADLVVVGVGVEPDVALAEEAGLAVDHGILVDATLRTSHPDVFAVGDVAHHDHPVLRRRIRVEHWDTAIEQAKVAARNLLGGQERYERLPYFFTDQYDLGMEYVGYAAGERSQVVLRGDPATGPWRAYWLTDEVVAAGMHVNEWGAIDEIREQVGHPLN